MRKLLIAAFVAAIPLIDASACVVPRPFSYRIFGRSDMVLNVRVIGFETESFYPFYGNRKRGALGILELEAVERTAAPSAKESGQNRLSWVGTRGRFKVYLFWSNPKAPGTWTGPTDAIVALTVMPLPDGRPAIFLAQDWCAGPAIVEDTAENMERIAEAQSQGRAWMFEDLRK